MNIFVLDKNPIHAARHLHDVHCRKQIIESAQMLANGFSLDRLARIDCPPTQSGKPRGHSYVNHPCSKWALASCENYVWLLMHGLTLCHEYTARFKKRHFTYTFMVWVDNHLESIFPSAAIDKAMYMHYNEKVDFVQCMPEQYKQEDAVQAYRDYYISEKLSLKGVTWTPPSVKPNWIPS